MIYSCQVGIGCCVRVLTLPSLVPIPRSRSQRKCMLCVQSLVRISFVTHHHLAIIAQQRLFIFISWTRLPRPSQRRTAQDSTCREIWGNLFMWILYNFPINNPRRYPSPPFRRRPIWQLFCFQRPVEGSSNDRSLILPGCWNFSLCLCLVLRLCCAEMELLIRAVVTIVVDSSKRLLDGNYHPEEGHKL